MTADNEVVLGVSEASKAKIDMSSYQDPLTVDATKIDVVEDNDNAHSAVSDSDSCLLTTDALNCDNDFGEAINGTKLDVIENNDNEHSDDPDGLDVSDSCVVNNCDSGSGEAINGTKLDVIENSDNAHSNPDGFAVSDSCVVTNCDNDSGEAINGTKLDVIGNSDNAHSDNLDGSAVSDSDSCVVTTDALNCDNDSGEAINGTKLDVVDVIGNNDTSHSDNPDGSAVFDSDSCVVTTDALNRDNDSVEAINRTKLDVVDVIGNNDNVHSDDPAESGSCVVTTDALNCDNDSGEANNGTKLDAVDVVGNSDNVHSDVPDGSAVSDSDSCVVTTDPPNCNNDSGEAIEVLDSKVLELQYEKVVEDIVQSLVIDETCSVSKSTQKEMHDMQNGTDVEKHEHEQLMAEDNTEVGVNNRGIVEPVDEYNSLSLSTEKEVLLQGNLGLGQPNDTMPDSEEHGKVEVEDPKAFEVTSEDPNLNNNYMLDSREKNVVEEEVVSKERMVESMLLDEDQCVALSDLCNGEVDNRTDKVYQANGTDYEEQNNLKLESEVEVEDQADLVSNSTPNLNCNKDSDIDAIKESLKPAMPLEPDTVFETGEHRDSRLLTKADDADPEIENTEGLLATNVESESVLESAASSPTSNGTNIAALKNIEFGSFRRADNPTISKDYPVQIGSSYGVNLESVLQPSSTIKPNKDAAVHGSDVPVWGKNGNVVQVVEDDKSESNTHQISSNTITASLSQASTDVMDTLKLGNEAATKPCRYIVKVPRSDDEKLREQLRTAQLLLDEKTHQRDGIQIEVQKKRNNCQVLDKKYRDARLEEISARKLLKLKRQEIDSVQVLINRVKNAISVGDMDCRMYSLEHKIEHETLSLKEEKSLIREIKQTKLLRDQLSSNIGSEDEVKQAFDQRDNIDGRLKILKKELDVLKDKVSKAEAATSLLRKNYDDENENLKALNAQFKNSNDVRQEVYKHFSAIKGELKEKSKYFWKYKDDARAANDYALRGDREALHSFCVNQVATMMELWNNNDEFRKEYVRCNTRSTVRRFKTLDGRSLGPDEEALVLPNYVDPRVNRQLSSPGMATSPSVVSALKEKTPVPPVKEEVVGDGKSIKVAEQKNRTRKSETVAQPIVGSGCSETVSSKVEAETRETNSDEKLQIEEQLKMATKAETLREKERDEELKEKRRSEEKAKALEALERKKRIAEKAQIRAEIRAQKEAVEKQKEKEKRLRKKERKNSSVVDAQKIDTNGESSTALELPNGVAKEFVVKENSTTAVKRPKETLTTLTKQSKTKVIPPPLRNKGKRKWKQAVFWITVIVIILFIIFGGEGGAFGGSNSQKNPSSRR